MSRLGLITALKHAAGLPAFGTLGEATRTLTARRDTHLRKLENHRSISSSLDYSPESLKVLEKFALESGLFSRPSEETVGFYFGEVLVRNAGFKWVVQESVFQPGRYEIGVAKNLYSIMLTHGRSLNATNNKRMQSLWREYQKNAI